MRFVNCIDKYEGQEIDFSAFVEIVDGEEIVFRNVVVQFKTNKILKGLVVLERVFDHQDKAKVTTTAPNPEDLEEINLGTKGAPRKV